MALGCRDEHTVFFRAPLAARRQIRWVVIQPGNDSEILENTIMLTKYLAAAMLALVVCGCAANSAVYWDRGTDSSNGGPPASWPCQATG